MASATAYNFLYNGLQPRAEVERIWLIVEFKGDSDKPWEEPFLF